MTWLRLDGTFPTHSKISERSDAAFRAHVEGLCHAALHLTDGHVPPGVLRRFATSKVRRELVAAGLWNDAPDGGIWIHDYLAYQPSRDAVIALRQKRADAGRKGGRAGRDE